MTRSDHLVRLLERVDRRAFLKAAGVMGGAAVLGGGALRSALRVLGGDQVVTNRRIAMGTFVEIQAVCDSNDLAAQAMERAYDEMDRLIRILSRHDSGSPLSHLNRNGRLDDPPRELLDVVLHSLDVHRATGGAFDPTVKPLIDVLERGAIRDADLAVAAECVGADGVRFSDRRIEFGRDGMGITLDGAAKGYIVDRMSDVLAAAGVPDHLVNAGGDIRTRGERAPGQAWRIAVEDPLKQGNYPTVIRMRDGAVATSGSYENFYDDDHTRHHIVDPATGVSPRRLVSTTVRAATVMDADALSTAVFVMGHNPAPESNRARVEVLTIDRNGRMTSTPGFNA